jgi:hypothetical protein
LGFAFLFAWILFGNYGRRDDWKSPGAVPGINRRLLSIDITDDNDINNTFGDVEVAVLCTLGSLFAFYSVIKFMTTMKVCIVILLNKLSLVEEMMDLYVTLSLSTVLCLIIYYRCQ